jgi:DNA-binding MarR family transcriptional regulator
MIALNYHRIRAPCRLVAVVNERQMAESLGIALSRYRQRQRHEVMIRTNWNRGDLTALIQVVQDPGRTTSDLAVADFVRPQTMIRHIEALEDAGLVVRRTDPADARRRLIFPTAAGKRLLAQQHMSIYGWLEDAIAGLTKKEKALLPDVIDVLNRISNTEQ